VENSCKHGNEPSGSIKCWEVLNSCTIDSFSRRAQLHESVSLREKGGDKDMKGISERKKRNERLRLERNISCSTSTRFSNKAIRSYIHLRAHSTAQSPIIGQS
jgi:hypothetical protein